MKILGIDPGSRATGYALLEVKGQEVRFVRGGVIRPPGAGSLPRRLARLGNDFERLLEHCRPDETAVEGIFHALHAKSALQLAHARGVILAVLAKADLPISEYSPLQVKKAVSGYGLADKRSLQALVERLLNVARGALARDAADAAAVALCHAQAMPLRKAFSAAMEKRRAKDAGPGTRREGPPTGIS